MKKLLARAVSILLVLAMLIPLASCSSTGTVIMSYGNSKITENMYRYWLSRYKAIFLTTYSDLKDSDDVWYSEIAEGSYTYNTYLTAVVLQNIKNTLLCMELCNQYGLELSALELESIDQYIDEMITEYGNGSKSAFNQIASAYGVNNKILKDCYVAEAKIQLLYDYFYGDNGIYQITDENRDSYYNSNYVRIQHLYINNAYKYVLNEDGTYQTDADTGYALTTSLTDEEIAEKNAIIETIQTALDDGTATYEELYEQYSEDKFYPNGYYLTTSTSFISEILTAAFTMEVGAVETVTSSLGTHIIKKYDLDEKAYANEDNADFFGDFESLVGQMLFQTELSNLSANITYDEDAIVALTIADVKACYNY